MNNSAMNGVLYPNNDIQQLLITAANPEPIMRTHTIGQMMSNYVYTAVGGLCNVSIVHQWVIATNSFLPRR